MSESEAADLWVAGYGPDGIRAWLMGPLSRDEGTWDTYTLPQDGVEVRAGETILVSWVGAEGLPTRYVPSLPQSGAAAEFKTSSDGLMKAVNFYRDEEFPYAQLRGPKVGDTITLNCPEMPEAVNADPIALGEFQGSSWDVEHGWREALEKAVIEVQALRFGLTDPAALRVLLEVQVVLNGLRLEGPDGGGVARR